MIATIQRIFASKSKRVFHPTRVIKDADAIMRRCFKKLISVTSNVQDNAFTRWKYYSFARHHKEKATVLYKGLRMAELYANQTIGMSVASSFSLWAQLAATPDKRTLTKSQKYLYLYLSKFPQSRLTSAMSS